MRLTEKWNGIDGLGYTCADYEVPKIIEKLGQLEDIEEELGIDLVTLFKALKDGFYVKGEDGKCFADFESPAGKLSLSCGELFYGHIRSYQYIKLKDYGKTWALTKKELE